MVVFYLLLLVYVSDVLVVAVMVLILWFPLGLPPLSLSLQ